MRTVINRLAKVGEPGRSACPPTLPGSALNTTEAHSGGRLFSFQGFGVQSCKNHASKISFCFIYQKSASDGWNDPDFPEIFVYTLLQRSIYILRMEGEML